MVRYLVIVGRRELGLCDYLTRQFAGDAEVHVFTERRRAERRQYARGREPDRRRRERRRPSLDGIRLPWFVLVRQVHQPPLHDPHAEPATPTTSAPMERTTMEETGPLENRKQLIRWMDVSRPLFGMIPVVVDELLAAEQECERLRQALTESRSENERLRAERAELAEALSNLIGQMTRPMHDIVQKLRIAPPDPA